MPLTILDIDNLLVELGNSFYTIPLMMALNIFFLAAALRYRRMERTYTLFVLYGALLLAINMAGITMSFFNIHAPIAQTLRPYAALCFVLIEFITFNCFFYHQFKRQHMQNKIAVIAKSYSLLMVLLVTYASIFPLSCSLKDLPAYLSFGSSLLILWPSLYYFYTLFVEPPTKNLLQEPSFWITTGITFVHSLNIPLFLMETYLFEQLDLASHSMNFINYIVYCFLFILLTIAFLCNRKYKNTAALSQLSTPLP